jgi:putative ribosome biogenesis GTPase RsgA
MHFQLKPPSVPHIRAKWVIEKLKTSPKTLGNISLFATGQTGSGKTTLGNRLLGIDYFLSTGRRDCTKEVNLVEFPIGLRYFDLPGVCSDDKLENINRVSLGLHRLTSFL